MPLEKKQIRIPDGSGGWKLVDAGTKTVIDQGKAQQSMQQAQEKDFFKRVGGCTEALNRYLKAYAKDHGFSHAEIAASVYLENCNIRAFFPEESGGTEAFDKTCADVWDWFKEQTTP
jgi:hypothetical protein